MVHPPPAPLPRALIHHHSTLCSTCPSPAALPLRLCSAFRFGDAPPTTMMITTTAMFFTAMAVFWGANMQQQNASKLVQLFLISGDANTSTSTIDMHDVGHIYAGEKNAKNAKKKMQNIAQKCNQNASKLQQKCTKMHNIEM